MSIRDFLKVTLYIIITSFTTGFTRYNTHTHTFTITYHTIYLPMSIRDFLEVTSTCLSPDLYREGPYVMIDPPSPVVILSTDEQTHFTCFVLGPMSETLRLEKLINDRVLTAGSDISYLQLYVNEIGDYGCRLMRDQDLISIATTTVVIGTYIHTFY